jgi:uncharacterized protein (TIGR02271 family)
LQTNHASLRSKSAAHFIRTHVSPNRRSEYMLHPCGREHANEGDSKMGDSNDPTLVSLDEGGWEVAEGEPDVRGWKVVTAARQRIGEVDDLLADPSAQKVRFITVELDRDVAGNRERTIRVPIDRARIHEEQKEVVIDAAANSDFGNLASAPVQPLHDDHVRVTRSAEELRIGKRQVQAGAVEVKKRVETEHVRENVTLRSEDVDVQRRPVTGTAQTGDVQITAQEVRVPVYEEQAIVEKRPVVKEEIVISKRPTEKIETVETELREERVDVERHADDQPSKQDRTRG